MKMRYAKPIRRVITLAKVRINAPVINVFFDNDIGHLGIYSLLGFYEDEMGFRIEKLRNVFNSIAACLFLCYTNNTWQRKEE